MGQLLSCTVVKRCRYAAFNFRPKRGILSLRLERLGVSRQSDDSPPARR
jgi:hypothetical protein